MNPSLLLVMSSLLLQLKQPMFHTETQSLRTCCRAL
ncbi:hypothetical protein SOVF_190990 [Spinacia oleracea]|nr:hypothetical protein SOVF_190990 [Spinacia oleracea]